MLIRRLLPLCTLAMLACGSGDDDAASCDDGETRACYDGPEGTAGVAACTEGVQTCSGGAWGACEGQQLPADQEICNGRDDTCSGTIDAGCPVSQITVNHHMCFLEEGALFCGGRNQFGEIALGFESTSEPITRVGEDSDWERIDSGGSTICALKAGEIYCWGANLNGELPFSGTRTTSPTRIPPIERATDVSMGSDVGCAVEGGELWCWGNLNPSTDQGQRQPARRIGDRSDWSAVAISSYRFLSCGIAGGELLCWGEVVNTTSDAPTRLGTGTDWFAVQVVDRQTVCGLREGGGLFCWNRFGNEPWGEGSDARPIRMTDLDGFWTLKTEGFWTLGNNVGRICALRQDELWCMGGNLVGSPLGPHSVLPAVGLTRLWPERSFQAATSDRRSCALSEGDVVCWGGTIPEFFEDEDELTAPRRYTDDGGWTAISTESSRSCGIRNGAAYCFGPRATEGLDLDIPDPVGPVLVDDTMTWTHIAAGRDRVCGIADGGLWCWGSGGSGSFRQLDAGPGWTDLSADNRDACGVRDGELRCLSIWERTEIVGWTSISMGVGHTCGLRGGELWCWGNNSFQQIGLDHPSSVPDPIRVGEIDDWDEVKAGYLATCARRGGELWCWGSRRSHDKGDNDRAPRLVAEGVTTFTPPMDTDQGVCWQTGSELRCANGDVFSGPDGGSSSSRTMTCAILDGDIWCWGGTSDFTLGMPEPPELRVQAR